jgi:ABC-type lipoprotein release transport system permease subunit
MRAGVRSEDPSLPFADLQTMEEVRSKASIGIMLARLAGKLFRALIYQVEATDTMTFTVVGIVLLCVATLASLLPSLRIARLDPAKTLREE